MRLMKLGHCQARKKAGWAMTRNLKSLWAFALNVLVRNGPPAVERDPVRTYPVLHFRWKEPHD